MKYFLNCYIFFLLTFFSFENIYSQKQLAENDGKIGVKAGLALNYIGVDNFTSHSGAGKYIPVPRIGLVAGMYSRTRMTNFFKVFDYRSDIKNWYFQYEINAAYRGGNFRYYHNDGSGFKHFSDSGEVRFISIFSIETPILLVCDFKNKQQDNLLFGIQPSYNANIEMYKGFDALPKFYGSAYYNDYLVYNRWGWAALLGYQRTGETVGFQVMAKFGLTSFNKNLALTIDNQTEKVTSYFPSTMKNYSLDFYLVF